jgi:hypothetical protein
MGTHTGVLRVLPRGCSEYSHRADPLRRPRAGACAVRGCVLHGGWRALRLRGCVLHSYMLLAVSCERHAAALMWEYPCVSTRSADA